MTLSKARVADLRAMIGAGAFTDLMAEYDRLVAENRAMRAALEDIASTVIIIKADSAPIDISLVVDLISKAQGALEQADKVKGEVGE